MATYLVSSQLAVKLLLPYCSAAVVLALAEEKIAQGLMWYRDPSYQVEKAYLAVALVAWRADPRVG